MAKTKGSVRSSQLITTYGIGSIVAVRDESFMIAGLDSWPVEEPDLFEPRLQRILNVRGFVHPPASDEGADIPVVRFPKFQFCPECHRLAPHFVFGGTWQERICSSCDAEIVPARFVMACKRGHIDDFPWFRWVHASLKYESVKGHDLFIQAGGATSSLADVEVTCSCGARRNLEGAFGKDALKGVTRCTGARPWLEAPAEENCPETPRALQRGASNVWFSVVRSAISIPPWSESAYRVLDGHWKVLRHIPNDSLHGTLVGMNISAKSGIPEDELVEAILRRKAEESGATPPGDLKSQEYEALVRGRADSGVGRHDFVCEEVPDLDDGVKDLFTSVSRVTRLREVRVLEAFSRILPAGQDNLEGAVSVLDAEKAVLPGIEVIGEGVFLRFNESRLTRWEADPSIRRRAETIRQRYEGRESRLGRTVARVITPRLLLIHTFAHALITQWALDSGYSTSALRERLYASDGQAGLLIYTATSDSAGSLGGVVSQTSPARLYPSLLDSIRRSSWCSADPLCIEAQGNGADALNLGACHACVLLPETSCEEMNIFLDRAMLIGAPDNPAAGYFSEWLETNWRG